MKNQSEKTPANGAAVPSAGDKAPLAKRYKIGDYYNENGKQGVVFEVWDDGRHGKIVSLDQTKAVYISRDLSALDEEYLIGASSFTDGKANTDTAMSHEHASYFPAFTWCRAKGEDWYLPAYDEIYRLIYNDDVYEAVNRRLRRIRGANTLKKRVYRRGYWSSTEGSGCDALAILLCDREQHCFIAVDDLYIRAAAFF